MKTINSETKVYSKLSTNLDSLRSRYYETGDDLDITVYFPAFEIYSYEYRLFELIASSKRVNFNVEWTQRPDYASYDNYGTVVYGPLLMYVNQIVAAEDFRDLDYIIIPSYNVILNLASRKPADDEFIGVNEPARPAPNYYKLYPLNEEDINKRIADENLEAYRTTTADFVGGELVDSTAEEDFASASLDSTAASSSWSEGSIE